MSTSNPIPNDAEPDSISPADPAESAESAGPTAEQPAQQAQQPYSQPATSVAPSAPERGKPRPRTGPIIWGALVLAFCLYVAQRTLAPGTVDSVTWLIAGVTGLGALLLAVGVVVLVRNGTNK